MSALYVVGGALIAVGLLAAQHVEHRPLVLLMLIGIGFVIAGAALEHQRDKRP